MKTIRIIILSCFSFFFYCLNAQREDFQTRVGIDISGDLGKTFGWSAEAQQRWKNNSGLKDRIVLQGSMDYAPLSFVKLGLGYRASFVSELNGNTSNKQRIHAEVLFDYHPDRFKLAYRSRLQYGFDDFQSIVVVGQQSLVWRHRFMFKYYPFGRVIHPYASAEVFYHLNTTEGRKLKGVRYLLGTDYLLSRHFSLGLNFLINKEINVSDPLVENIVSVNINYKF